MRSRFSEGDYDALGNLTSRTSKLGSSNVNNDVGTLSYTPTTANNAGVHAVTAAGGNAYRYDKYGNMTSRAGDTIEYNVFNKPTRITGSGTSGTTTIDYDANHDRFRETNGSTVTYTFVGGLYEEVVEGATTTQKAYVDGVILNTKVLNSGTQGSNDTLYLHTDNLGSVEAYSDRLGAFVSRMSFSDWGKRQQSDWKNTTSSLSDLPTANGYTGHHQLDQHKLVHMGGRVYDPSLGRFMSADLFVQSPYSSQSFNRYTYVSNNPMSRVDPTGYLDIPDNIDITGFRCPVCDQASSAANNAYSSMYSNSLGSGSLGNMGSGTTFDPKNLLDTANDYYGYDSSPEGLKATFGDGPDGVMEIKITVPREEKNGKGDYKNNLSDLGFDSKLLDDFGNWHFGVVAAAHGFNLEGSMYGAGWYQVMKQGRGNKDDLATATIILQATAGGYSLPDSVARQWTRSGFTWGDNPGDSINIMNGWDYYHAK